MQVKSNPYEAFNPATIPWPTKTLITTTFPRGTPGYSKLPLTNDCLRIDLGTFREYTLSLYRKFPLLDKGFDGFKQDSLVIEKDNYFFPLFHITIHQLSYKSGNSCPFVEAFFRCRAMGLRVV